MNTKKINYLKQGLGTAFIDYEIKSNLAYKPQFISNNFREGQKVLSSLEEEFGACDEFCISVAFITMSGITPLLLSLQDLEKRNIPGRILTTDYLAFSQPKALRRLAEFKNIELRMYRTGDGSEGFHTKGYIFKKDDMYRIIVGSSNVTQSALTLNREWNTKIVSTRSGEYTQDIISEFDELWNSEKSQSFDKFIDEYTEIYTRNKIIREQKEITRAAKIPSLDAYRLKPNSMQVGFIANMQKIYEEGKDKALLLSATGTGKTMASAFAMREMQPRKILFVVHREQIAKQAMSAYRLIFGNSKTYGLLSGSHRDMNADLLFSTMQMMSKPEIYNRFDKNAFDAVILDECHHAGSESYRRIMNYFKPRFWLGMTASPDTNNYDIYELFDHNIAYEIRLSQALEEDLLCPFHYFGISELEIDGKVFDDSTGLKNFSALVSDIRVDYVIEKAQYFGFSGERVKGLVFCSRKEEARELSRKFNERKKKDGNYYRTAVLTGDDKQAYREDVISALVNDSKSESQLDYIFTVDIFNEGVDIPEINQVIMLRPTQSPVIFIQQLGRGLRKYPGKEYVVILDFIGNYTNNFMIPVSLFGDSSWNKDTMRRYIREGARIIPGSSTIHFDEVSKKRIYASIDKARTNDVRIIKESYNALKHKLGRIPTILEFKQYGSIDVVKIFEKFGSYYAFLKKYEPDYSCMLSGEEESIVEYMSRKLVLYKRIHEIALLRSLIIQQTDRRVDKQGNNQTDLQTLQRTDLRTLQRIDLQTEQQINLQIEQQNRMRVYLDKLMASKHNLYVSPALEESVYRNLTNLFPKEEERKKYDKCVFVKRNEDGSFVIAEEFWQRLKNPKFREMVLELLSFGEQRYDENYSHSYKDTCFQLYQKYTYEDVCRLLCWKRNLNAQNIGGYFYDSDTKTMPVFINYDKAEDAIAYEDRFVSENLLIALSKHPRKITSQDAMHIYKKNPEDAENRIYLFVRKNKDDKEAKEFYFLGEIFAQGEPKPVYMESTKDSAFEILYRLDVPVRSDIYDYIVQD